MDISKIKKQIEREQKTAQEAGRKAQVLGAQLTRALRIADTRRKILAGAWAIHKKEKSEEFRAMMMREFDHVWLSRDDDRQLFGLAPLSDEEKEQRAVPRTAGRPRKKEVEEQQVDGDDGMAGATPSPFDSSGSAPSADETEKESEAA